MNYYRDLSDKHPDKELFDEIWEALLKLEGLERKSDREIGLLKMENLVLKSQMSSLMKIVADYELEVLLLKDKING